MKLAKYKNSLLAAALIVAGLNAGLFFCFSTAINPGFAHLDANHYVAATQMINQYIQNPVFFLVFMGAVIILPLAAYAHKQEPTGRRFKLLLIASALYIVGTFGVTMGGNVPINDKFAAIDLATAPAEQVAKTRDDLVKTWNAWHNVRTVAAIGAFALIIAASLPVTEENHKKGQVA
jgi:uncharacterized membrane protein